MKPLWPRSRTAPRLREAKVKDQEEELDEQAGTIQMLEQVLRAGPRRQHRPLCSPGVRQRRTRS